MVHTGKPAFRFQCAVIVLSVHNITNRWCTGADVLDILYMQCKTEAELAAAIKTATSEKIDK
jgi:hypothetical protein